MKLREIKTGEYCLVTSCIGGGGIASIIFQVGNFRSENNRTLYFAGPHPSWWEYPSMKSITCHADYEVIKVKIKKEKINVSN
ncbi:hypothetical protein [Pseudoalteromonas sp. 1181_04]|uniref:hypothetical protein n=1 Tax=Pseudoalteromonas sp. 1181_04 TaxID=2604450 RepID=UPI004062FB5C